MTPRGVLAFCREKEVKAIDIRFTDLLGTWQHVTVPVNRLSETSFEQGFAVDTSNHPASSSCDRLVIPQASPVILDPFATVPTLILIGSLQVPITREDDPFDSRIIAQRAIHYLEGTGIADRARFAATCEFYLFNDVHEDSQVDVTSLPIDSSFDFRNAIMESLIDADIPVSQHFQIDRSGGQAAIELDSSDLVSAADAIMSAKFMVKSTAKRHGQSATFLPKPVESLRDSGMPLYFSLWRGDEPLFGGQEYGGLSEIAMLAIGGILHHASALTAICNPTTNSYRRLHHSIEPPFHLGYSQQSRRIACWIPSSSSDPRTKCIQFRTPDASANPYLALAAILMAAIDGIQNKIETGTPLSIEALQQRPTHSLPRSLWDALDCLEQDSSFLTRGDVFSPDMLDRWLHYKRHVEQPAVESQPTPAEYQRYFDC